MRPRTNFWLMAGLDAAVSWAIALVIALLLYGLACAVEAAIRAVHDAL